MTFSEAFILDLTFESAFELVSCHASNVDCHSRERGCRETIIFPKTVVPAQAGLRHAEAAMAAQAGIHAYAALDSASSAE